MEEKGGEVRMGWRDGEVRGERKGMEVERMGSGWEERIPAIHHLEQMVFV